MSLIGEVNVRPQAGGAAAAAAACPVGDTAVAAKIADTTTVQVASIAMGIIVALEDIVSPGTGRG